MALKIDRARRCEIEVADDYLATITLVPPNVPASDPLRESHDDRSITVSCSSGSLWCDVHTGDGKTFAANAVFGADEEAVRCDTIEVMPGHRRKGIASDLYAIASAIFEAPVVPSEILSDDAQDFWGGRTSIRAE